MKPITPGNRKALTLPLQLSLQNKSFVEMTPSWKVWKSLATSPHFPQWLGYRFAESTFPQSRRRSFWIVKNQNPENKTN
jgi:hypothetical protein